MNETIIIGLIAILIVLAYITYQIVRFRNSIPKKTDKDILDEQDKLAARNFFGKHINIDGTGYRTTTFGQIITQALKSNDFVKELKIHTVTGEKFIGETPIEEILKDGEIIEESRDHPIEDIDRMGICKSEVAFERYIEKHLELALKEECPCPCNPDKYCNWAEKMLQKFIIDTNYFNVVSIQVVDPADNKILATSAHNNIEKYGNYSILTMKQLSNLSELPAGKIIRVELQWLTLGSDKLKSIDFCNKIPQSKNGKLILPEKNAEKLEPIK